MLVDCYRNKVRNIILDTWWGRVSVVEPIRRVSRWLNTVDFWISIFSVKKLFQNVCLQPPKNSSISEKYYLLPELYLFVNYLSLFLLVYSINSDKNSPYFELVRFVCCCPWYEPAKRMVSRWTHAHFKEESSNVTVRNGYRSLNWK